MACSFAHMREGSVKILPLFMRKMTDCNLKLRNCQSSMIDIPGHYATMGEGREEK